MGGMKATLTVTSNVKDMLKRLGDDVRGGLVAGTTRAVGALEANLVKEEPVVTSNMVNSTTSEVSSDGTRGTATVQASYAEHVARGTGLFGPGKKKITPKNAKALKTPYGPRKSVKGQKPNPFDERAMEKTDFQAEFEAGMSGYLERKGWTK